MIFVDTNYFLRFLLHDNEAQYQEAKRLFLDAAQSRVKLFTSSLVFFEINWVLSQPFKQDKESLCSTLYKILNLSINYENRKLLIDALLLFGSSNLSLEDCYHLMFAKDIQAVDFKTFDKKLKKAFVSS